MNKVVSMFKTMALHIAISIYVICLYYCVKSVLVPGNQRDDTIEKLFTAVIQLVYIFGFHSMVEKYYKEEWSNEWGKFYMLKVVEYNTRWWMFAVYIWTWVVAISAGFYVYLSFVDEYYLLKIIQVKYDADVPLSDDIIYLIHKVIYIMFGASLTYVCVYSVWWFKGPNLYKLLGNFMKTKFQ